MAFTTKYTLDIATINGDGKQSGFTKLINEFVWIYGVLSGLFSPSTGHKHTGGTDDAPKLVTASYTDGSITLVKLASDAISPKPTGIPPKGGAMPFTGTFGGTGNKYPMEDGAPRLDWHICDGTDGTIDFRDRIVMAAGSIYVAGTTGGEASHTLTINEIPTHSHTLNGSTFQGGVSTSPSALTDNNARPISSTTQSIGGGLAHNNLPPYYALCYIQRIS